MNRVLLALVLATACATPPLAMNDAGSDAPVADAALVHGIHWAVGSSLPEPLAYATAQIFPVGASSYVYVFGGSSASRSSLGTFSSAVYRSRIGTDDTLGSWERVADISPSGMPQGLVGHGILPINDAAGNPGAALAGGGSSTSALPVVLAIYCDRSDGRLFDWSIYPPVLNQGQSFGVFAPFDPFSYALVGGMVGGAPSGRVEIAPINNAATAMTWIDGPSLPVPRARHSWLVFGQQVYVFGGENNDGTVSDILRTTRDAVGDVSGWERVGTLDGAPVTHASFLYQHEAWVVGGIDGTTFDGSASARVRHGVIGSDGHVAAFVDADESLPMPLAASAFATDYDHFFLIGGMTTPDLTATDTVIIGTIY